MSEEQSIPKHLHWCSNVRGWMWGIYATYYDGPLWCLHLGPLEIDLSYSSFARWWLDKIVKWWK